MKFHPEELELARSYTEVTPVPGLSREQLKAILDRGRQLFKWHKAHPVLHALINLCVFVLLFTADYYVLLALPSWLLADGRDRRAVSFVLAALTTGGLHSWLLYSLGVFSMHEGAAHGIRVAILKDGSPSCGSRSIYDGTFSGRQTAGEGVTASRLRAAGVRIFSEFEIDSAAACLIALDATGDREA